ncbi:MAG: hypothetical protein KDD99_02765 [Bacteroidetes bacterium]|nr:hypothetical protein [Bacteroidota bacterium]
MHAYHVTRMEVNNEEIMKKILAFIVFTGFIILALGQDGKKTLSGEVTYVTSQSVYVKFENTEDIEVGSMLQLASTQTPCLLVKNKSTTSCVCTTIRSCEVKKGDKIIFTPEKKAEPQQTETVDQQEETEEADLSETTEPLFKERIRGRFSVSGYNLMSSDRDNRYRLMSRLSLNAQNINNSRFSFETYLNYRKIFLPDTSKFSPQTTYFNVYNLALTYDIDPGFSVTIGRKINPKTASLGAIDGLQAEKNFGKAYVGGMVGFRPDIVNFGFNPNLLEYGGYVGANTDEKAFRSQTTLGFIEQRNQGNIDRRYAYLQHSSTISRNLHLFSSLEMDVFSKVNGEVTNEIRIPNLFVSGRYRFGRKMDLTLSYDSRKRILYYETFQTEIERLLDDDLARQGIRARLNFRPVKYLLTGVSYSKRFQSDFDNKSDNIYGYATLSKVPGIGGRLMASYNMNVSNYLTSNIASLRYSRSLSKKLDGDFYYRIVKYTYLNSQNGLWQHYMGTSLSYTISRKLALNLSGDFNNFIEENNIRIYVRVIRRFYEKKK